MFEHNFVSHEVCKDKYIKIDIHMSTKEGNHFDQFVYMAIV